jgi:serine/threonine-protein kinase
VLVVALIGGGAYLIAQALVGNEEPKRVSVPPVVGLSLQEAEQDLVAAGLEVGDVTKEGSQEQPGTVLSQDPAEGATVEEGSPVDLVVAKAPATVAVPDLRGLTIAEAQERLAAEELLLGSRQEQANSDFPAGEIYDQFPAPAEEVFKGSFVDVFISTGPQLVAVPDVTCRSVGSASSELRNAGLVPVVGGTAPMNPNCPINPDRVAETDPAAGAQVEAGSTVTLFTGEPASPTTTPSP